MKKICYIFTLPLTVRAFFLQQLDYLSREGFDIFLICQDDGKVEKELPEKVKFIPLNIPRGINFYGMITAIISLIKIFSKYKFDLIQYSTPNAALCASLAGMIANIPIRNYHLMGLRFLGFCGLKKMICKLFEKLTCILSTDIECVSYTNLELCIKNRLFDRSKGVVVWNGSSGGVDLKRFNYKRRESWRNEIRNKLDIKKEEFVYGFVGRVTKDKGINELLESFFKIKQDKLLIVGDLESNHNIKSELLEKALAEQNIIWVGYNNDIERYFAAIDMLLLPSYREGFGNVIIEAGAMGVTTIASDIAGSSEVVKNIGGHLCKSGDIVSLSNKMREKKIQPSDMISYRVEQLYDSNTLNREIAIRKTLLLNKRLKKNVPPT